MGYAISADELLITIQGSSYSFWKSCADGKIMIPEKTREVLKQLPEQVDSLRDLLWDLNYYGYGKIEESEVKETGRSEICFFDDY